MIRKGRKFASDYGYSLVKVDDCPAYQEWLSGQSFGRGSRPSKFCYLHYDGMSVVAKAGEMWYTVDTPILVKARGSCTTIIAKPSFDFQSVIRTSFCRYISINRSRTLLYLSRNCSTNYQLRPLRVLQLTCGMEVDRFGKNSDTITTQAVVFISFCEGDTESEKFIPMMDGVFSGATCLPLIDEAIAAAYRGVIPIFSRIGSVRGQQTSIRVLEFAASDLATIG